jgi:hypothetical protein
VSTAAAHDDVLWVPPTADGPGQALSAPGMNRAGGGYPIYLSDTTGNVTDVQVTLTYNPAFLTVIGLSGPGLMLQGTSVPGQADLHYSGPALAAGSRTPLGFLIATVPSGTSANPTPYKAEDLLHLTGVTLNGGTIPVATSDALHLVAYVGDADGNGSYNNNDAVVITRALLNTDTGSTAYPIVDPVIVADTDGVGFIPADAALQANEAGVSFPTLNLSIPPVPAGVHFIPIPAQPILTLFTPSADAITATNLAFNGQVNLSAVASLQGQLDGGPKFSVALDALGNFSFTTALPLDGSADGTHTLALQAGDLMGNVLATTAVPFTLLARTKVVTPTLDPTSDSGPSDGDGITNATTPLIHVAAPSGLTVGLYVNGRFTRQSTAVNGSASFALGPFAQGTYQIAAAVQPSPLSNFVDLSNPLSITILATPPPAPTFDLAAGTADLGPDMTSSSHVTLVGQVGKVVVSDIITLGTSGPSALTSAAGTFQLPGVTLTPGSNVLTLQAEDLAGNVGPAASLTVTYTPPTSAPPPNAVLVWNQATLNAIQADGTDPVMASRALAMVQSAVYDAVNNIEGTPAYYVKVAAPADASVNAAVDQAADDVLNYLYPAQQATFAALLSSQLALLSAGQGTTDGQAVGQAVASAIIAMRVNDGATGFVDFEPGTVTGDWQPTAPAFAPALDPQWANLVPFALTSPSQFDPAGPPALTSQAWADAVNQEESLGAVDSTTRTSTQTTLAKFWNDAIGTNTPSGHWNAIAQTVAQQQGESLVDDARLFAELNVSMADAGIATWNTKYRYNTWRPITVIQSGGDGVNPAVAANPNWIPLLTTPNFPEYTSGHSAFSMAAATVLDSFFGNNVTFTTTEPTTTLSMTYTSFDQAAQDAGMSRLYGGIHFLFSIQDGWTVGQNVANFDLATFSLTKATAPPKVTLQSVLPSGASKTNVTITGAVTDNLSGVASLAVQVDGGSYASLTFDTTTGSFSFPIIFPLDGSADGPHTIAFQATNFAGIVAPPVPFTFTLATKAPVLTLTSPGGGTLAAGATLAGTVTTDAGVPIVCLCYAFDGSTTMIPVSLNAHGSFSQALNLSKLVAGTHTLTVTVQDAAGNTSTQTLTLTLAAAIPLIVTDLTPTQGSTDVGVTFRPEVFFSRSIDTTTLNSSNFYAMDTTGTPMPATIVPSDDGTYAWLFFINSLPGASTITLTVNGSTIKTADGTLLDADGNGTPGSVLTQTFITVNQAPVPGTTLSGVVADPGLDDQPGTRDDYQTDPTGVYGSTVTDFLRPIQGVKVYILGQASQAVVTDAQGRFTLTSVPTGDVKLAVEGNVPGVMVYDPAQMKFVDPSSEGLYFPQMTLDLTNLQPGVANTVMGNMGTTQQQTANTANLGVYLPRVQLSILQTASTTTATTVGVTGPSGLGLTPQQQSELKLTVMPNSAIGMNGTPMSSFQVGISTVPPQIVMDMLPPGVMQHTFDITIQAPGVATFSTPAQLTFPNVFHAAPGSQLDVLSFDHTTGRLVIDGTATVTADGMTVVTDPGTGVTQPGWHGLTAPGTLTEAKLNLNNAGPLSPGTAIDAQCVGGSSPMKIGMLYASTSPNDANSIAQHGTFELDPGYRSLMSDAHGAGFRFIQVITYDDEPVDWNGSIITPAGTPNGAGDVIDTPNGGWDYQAADGGDDHSPFYESDTSNDPSTGKPFAASDLSYPDLHTGDGVNPGGSTTKDAPRLNGPNHRTLFTTFIAYEDQSNLSSQTVDILGGYTWGIMTDASGTVSPIDPTFIQGSDLSDLTLTQLQLALIRSGFLGWTVNNGNQILPCSGGMPDAPPTVMPAADPAASSAAGFGSDPKYYYSFQLLTGVTVSGKVEPDQQISTFLPAHTPFKLYAYQPSTNLSSVLSGITNASGKITDLGTLTAGIVGGTDTNGDGIPDVGKLAMGLPLTGPDRTVDGLSYAANLEAGLDPLGSGAGLTGVAASLPLQGQAQSVVLAGTALDPTGPTAYAYVATGSYGLAIVNASDFEHPVLLGQIPLPGNSTDVAVDNNLQIAAVASTTGLNLVNVSNPVTPRLLQTISVESALVRVKDGVAYAAVAGQIQSYDLLTGDLLQSLLLSVNNITGLALDGSFLYVLDAGNKLRVVDISNALMTARGSVTLASGATLASGSGALVVGGGLAYVGLTRFFNPPLGAVSGYITANVSNPDSPVAVSGTPSSAAAGAAVAVNGSGIALTVGGDLSGPAVDVFGSANPANVSQFETSYSLPVSALGVAIGDGIGFVADGSAGLQVVNYLPFDTRDVAPTASISLPASAIVGTSGGLPEVVEGSVVDLQAAIADDVQVSHVELLVNGQIVQTADSFPFDLSTTLPTIARVGSTPVTIQVRAVDTGGNVGLSNLLTVLLVRDTVPPTLLSSNVVNGAIVGKSHQAIMLNFSKPLAAATVTASNFVLTGPGGVVAPTNLQFRRRGATVDLTYPILSVGNYQFVIHAAAVTDVAGNALGTADQVIGFNAAEFSISWINPDGGFWDTPSNWSTGVVPGPSDDVYINLPSHNLVTFRSGTVTAGSLTVASPFALTGGALNLLNPSTINGPFTMSGGTLAGPGNLTVGQTFAWTGGTMAGSGLTQITATGALTLSGSGTLTLNRNLETDGPTTWTGNLAVTMNAATWTNDGSLTISSSSIVQGAGSGGSDAFLNNGTFTQQGDGTLSIGTGSTGVAFNNAGTVAVNAGTLQLGGGGTQSGTFALAGGSTLALNGTHTFTGSSPSVSGSGKLAILGGTVTAAVNVSISNLTLSAGTLGGAGTVTVTGSLAWTGGTLAGPGKTVVASPAILSLGGSALQLNSELDNQGTATWTSGNLQMNSGTLVNSGTFTANSSFFTLSCFGVSGSTNTFSNTGTFIDQGTGMVLFTVSSTAATFNNAGTVNVNTGTLNLNTGASHSGTFNIASGATLELGGAHVFTNSLPISGDGNLVITSGTDTYPNGLTTTGNLTFQGGSFTVAGGVTAGTLTVSGGSVILNAGAAVSNLVLSSGTLSSSGQVTVNSALTWTGGTLAVAGKTVVASSATLSLGGSALQLNSELDNQGTATWTSGSLQMNNGTLVNSGTFTANSSFFTLNCSGVAGSTNTFSNTGTFTDQGTGMVQFTGSTTAMTFDNAGTVNVNAGTLNLNGGGSQSGTFNLASGATLSLGGSHTFATAALITGNGNLTVTSGTDTYPHGLTTSGSLVFQGDSFTVNGPVSATSLTVSGGTAVVNGATTVSNLTLSSGTLSGSGQVTVSGTMAWTGGTLAVAGKTVVASSAILSLGGSALQLNSELDNQGTATWTSGALQMNNGTLVNSGTFTANSSFFTLSCFGVSGSTNTFSNTGTFIDQGTGMVQFTGSTTAMTFDNAGTVNVNAGTLNLNGGGSQSGTFNLASEATLSLGGSHTFATAALITGNGNLTVTSGTDTYPHGLTTSGSLMFQGGSFTVNGPVSTTSLTVSGGTAVVNSATTVSNLTVSSGTLSGSGQATVSGTMAWTGGTLAVVGKTVVASSATLSLGGSAIQLNSELDNQGTATWTSGTLQMNNGTLVNSGTFTANSSFFTLSCSGVSGSTNTFSNTGTFTDQGTGMVLFTVSSTAVTFNNAGIVNVNAGTLNLANSGANSGMFAVAAGATLNITGNFTQTAAGSITVQLGGTASDQFSHISVSGTATLNGTLSIVLVGGFVPTSGQTFQIMSWSSVSGVFSTINDPMGVMFALSYQTHDLLLTTD